MATVPGTALPGTTVPISSLIGTGGAQGLQGIQGIQGVNGSPGPPGISGAQEVGSVKAWPSVTPPATWMNMDGSAVSRTLYPDLFNLVGTTFGAGDGSSTFNLPDARSNFIIGAGQGTGLSNYVLGTGGGEEKHALVTGELASHTHSIAAGQFNHGHGISDPTHVHAETVNASTASGAGGVTDGTVDEGAINTGNNTMGAGTGIGIAANTLPAGVTAAAGSGTAHNNLPPYLVLVYIIKVSAGGGPTAQAPIADETQPGLMNALSGNATDVVCGDNACRPLPIANTTQAGIVNILSGNTTDYLGGDNACHALPPGVGPTADYYDKDDFIAGPSATASKLFLIGNSGAAGAVSGFYVTSQPGHPGVVQLAPGTTASAWSRAYINDPFAAFDPNMTLTIQGVMAIPSGSFAGANQFFFGVATSIGPALVATQSYAGFLALSSSSANWTMYTRNLAVNALNTPTNVPVGSTTTWHVFKIICTGAPVPTVQFFIDGVLVGTVSDNSVPVATAMTYIGFSTTNSTGTNNYSLFVDAFDILVQPGGPTRFQR